ncbi:U3 small nucleolar RNA-associated protein 6 homolog [Stegostoma tigrinum]|uniref:U3 small nucleolar RNA-associated protein 6 homolog n=1 Tax=Stegostoma tigrinum TaxID=3053191 RepID=UPI00202B5EDB|nr:U3 small nucleolar RNA-associated protein 6 homolog [Stegostoma tigrinum]
MAERVQWRLEERLPELEQLQRVGLLSGPEGRALMKKVTALEHKVQRRMLNKESFISYIQYEINFLELIKRRRVRAGYYFKKEEIEYAIVNRIHALFRRALSKWKADVQLWLSHIAFCKKWNAKLKLSKVFSAMLAIHPDKPALWMMAAKWEMEDQLSSESARHLFLRALRFHPESQKLYQEYFRMELMHVEKMRKEKQLLEMAELKLTEAEYPEEIVRGDLARIVYKNAIEKIPGDAEFHLSFWTIAVMFDFTQDLCKEIVEDLQTLHADHPVCWDFVARQELDADLPVAECSKQTKASEVARREEQCWAVYEKAVASVPTEAMWKCYISFCLERFKRKTNNEFLRNKRLNKVLNVFEKASESSLLPQAFYKQWLRLLVDHGDAEKALRLVKSESANFAGSVQMWQSSLEVLIELQSPDVSHIFQEAFQKVPAKDTLPLWLLCLDWSESTSSVDETESVYQRALQTPIAAVSVAVKERYVDWALKAKGYKRARKVFSSLCENGPFSLEFFKKMIAIEKQQECSRMEHLREYYERALREFGSTNADLWLEYIKEERGHPQGKPELTGQIHWRAMKTLAGTEVDQFVSQYTLLQTGHL